MSTATKNIRNRSRLVLDISKTANQAPVHLIQGDTARQIIFSLVEDGRPYAVPPGAYVALTAQRMVDGIEAPIFEVCVADHKSGLITCHLSEESTAVDGTFTAQLFAFAPDGTTLACPWFTLIIRRNRFPHSVIDAASFDALRDLVAVFGNDREEVLWKAEDLCKQVETMAAQMEEINGTYQDHLGIVNQFQSDLADETLDRLFADEDLAGYAKQLSAQRMVEAQALVDSLGDMSLLQDAENEEGNPEFVRAINAARQKAVDAYNTARSSGKNGTIGGYTFWNKGDLFDMEIYRDILHIGVHAFSGCTGLRWVSLPESLTSMGAYAFAGCTQLTSITVPADVIKIGEHALDIGTATAKAYITFKSSVPIHPEPVMDTTRIGALFVPSGCADAYKAAWPGLASLIQESPTMRHRGEYIPLTLIESYDTILESEDTTLANGSTLESNNGQFNLRTTQEYAGVWGIKSGMLSPYTRLDGAKNFVIRLGNPTSIDAYVSFQPSADPNSSGYAHFLHLGDTSGKMDGLDVYRVDMNGQSTVAVCSAEAIGSGYGYRIPAGFNGYLVIPLDLFARDSLSTVSIFNYIQRLSATGFAFSQNKQSPNLSIEGIVGIGELYICGSLPGQETNKEKKVLCGNSILTLTVADDLNQETHETQDDAWGGGKPYLGGVIFNTIGNTLVSASGFGTIGLPYVNFSGVAYLVFALENLATTNTIQFGFLLGSDSGNVTLSSKLAVNKPVYLLDHYGTLTSVTVRENHSNYFRATVELPAAFKGFVLVPLAALSTSWDGTTAAFTARKTVSKFSVFAVGPSHNIDLLWVSGVYTAGALPRT